MDHEKKAPEMAVYRKTKGNQDYRTCADCLLPFMTVNGVATVDLMETAAKKATKNLVQATLPISSSSPSSSAPAMSPEKISEIESLAADMAEKIRENGKQILADYEKNTVDKNITKDNMVALAADYVVLQARVFAQSTNDVKVPDNVQSELLLKLVNDALKAGPALVNPDWVDTALRSMDESSAAPTAEQTDNRGEKPKSKHKSKSKSRKKEKHRSESREKEKDRKKAKRKEKRRAEKKARGGKKVDVAPAEVGAEQP